MASQVWDAETVLIQYASYIFFLLNIFLHLKFWHKNTHKNSTESLWKPQLAFSTLYGFSDLRRGNSTYSIRGCHFFHTKKYLTLKMNTEGLWKPKFAFLLYIASQVWDAETVLIQYASFIFLLLNIFLHSKFRYQNTHKNNA